MFASKTTEHMSFLIRQLSSLPASLDTEVAIERLREACPPQYASEIDQLAALLAGNEASSAQLGHSQYATLAKLLPEVRGTERQFLNDFVDYMRHSKVVFETYWAGVVSMVWYLVVVSVLMVGLSILFGSTTIPAFAEMASEFQAELPSFTSAVFASSGIGIPVFAIVVTLIVATVVWFVVSFQRRIQRMEPLRAGWLRVPMSGRLGRYYNLGLMLNYSRLLINSGVAPADGLAIAARISNTEGLVSLRDERSQDGDFADFPLVSELRIAHRLDNLGDEIRFQCDEHVGRLSVVLVESRDQFSLIFKLVIYSLVAALVIAMYLPIFKIGSIV